MMTAANEAFSTEEREISSYRKGWGVLNKDARRCAGLMSSGIPRHDGWIHAILKDVGNLAKCAEALKPEDHVGDGK